MTTKKIKKSHQKVEQLTRLKEKPKGIWTSLVIGILSKTPEAINFLEIYRMTREMYLTQREIAIKQMKLRYCLYSILAIMIIASAILLAVFYLVLNMTSVGLSFVGPLITGILGIIVVLLSGRK
jgi:fatty-acid desaturase